MADIIKIKRSDTTATPASLGTGELAYSENSGNLFIGRIADGVPVKIGGKTDADKLSGIEANATADQTGAEIKTAYEAEANAYTDTKDTKLSGIEASADVTDATNVAAAGAVMESDATTAAMSFVVDEDNMVSDLDTKVPTQQSVKAYVDTEVAAAVASEMSYKGAYNASTNSPDLDVSPSGIAIGDMYTVTAAGNFFSTAVGIGDVIISNQLNPTLVSHWTIVEATNLDAAGIEAIVSHDNLLDFTADEHFTQAAISITKSQVSDFTETDYATGAEGDLATSALQDITAESIEDLSDVYSSMTPTDGQALIYDTTNGWQAETISTGGLGNIVEDTTPQLGGDLDLNGSALVDASDSIVDVGRSFRVQDTSGSANTMAYVYPGLATGDAYVRCHDHTSNSSNYVGLRFDANISKAYIINTSPNALSIDGLNWPTADGTANQVIKTDGSGNLSFVDAASGGTTTFVGLTDTPANFTAAGGYIVKVNAGATALEYQNGLDGGTF